MGIIYEAVQLSLGRRVALKVLPLAAGLDNRSLQRFRQEAQAAAQLHHTNIVPVYAVGCERGVHYYAMQLIDGSSLDQIISQLCRDAEPHISALSSGTRAADIQKHSQQSNPTEVYRPRTSAAEDAALAETWTRAEVTSSVSADFSTQKSRSSAEFYRAAARLMMQAAEALEYAHQQGIVHRDIKPANLLIDTRRNLWITDFGLAHLHGAQNLTQTGDLVGTIRYASPEQVSGQRVVLDHRTDLYSLGATFYELITLKPVFSGLTRQVLLQQVLCQEPVSPRSIHRSVPPELDTILLKLLNKIATDRYDSAQELADDLRRFLHDEPIHAKPPSLMERMRKWGRRHPAYIGALFVVLFVTLLISGFSNWRIAQANRRERLRADEAEQRFSQARQAVDLLIEVSENDLDRPPLQSVQKRLLESALVYYQDFVAQYRGNPAREAELIAVQRRLNRVLDDLSVMEGAWQLVLIAEESVQRDLALDEAERRRIGVMAKQLAERRLELIEGYQQFSAIERRSRFLEFARANEEVLEAILDEQQTTRLEQIHTQFLGFTAFNEPQVVELLHLSDSQRQAVREIEAETFFLTRERRRAIDEEARHVMQESTFQAAMDKCLALLSPDQLNRWKQLIGPPFEGRLSNVPPGMLPLP